MRFIHVPFSEKVMFFEALLFMFTTKLVLVFLPFRICIRLFTKKIIHPEPSNIQQLVKIKKAIYRANRLTFWKNVCLVQSFTARWMLNRRGITSKLSIGVMHDHKKKILAHAWINANDLEIVSKNFNYHELMTF